MTFLLRRSLALLVALAWLLPSTPRADGVWKQATPGRAFAFPADHASHPDYRVEWWYYTGNLDARDGRRFGYQLTFFRVGVDPHPAVRSRWAVRDLFMAHFAITDVNGKTFRFAERLNRAGPGWAGADVDRYRVWNEGWSASRDDAGVHRLRAAGERFAIDLALTEGGAPVLQGRGGYSQKGTDPGNASYYYSLTRMPTAGALTLNGEHVEVTGLSWMDHEFGTSVLEPAQRGWDWLSLQLDDGSDLMVYRLRRADGSADPHSSATLVEPGRAPLSLDVSGFSLTPGRTWTSRASGGRYPVEWQVDVPGSNGRLTVTAALDGQELRTPESTGVTYWEGAVDVRGTLRGHAVKGRGYLEMTGYAGGPLGRVFDVK